MLLLGPPEAMLEDDDVGINSMTFAYQGISGTRMMKDARFKTQDDVRHQSLVMLFNNPLFLKMLLPSVVSSCFGAKRIISKE
jgi:hypothetical protein